MGLFSKIFQKSNPSVLEDTDSPKTFIDCLDIVHAWKVQATFDPDFNFSQDKILTSALNSRVTCPYCNNKMYFSEAVINTGVAMRVICPVCKTEPRLHSNSA